MIGVTKPDGSVTTTVYDNKQRVISTVERTSANVIITGFEYTYDALSRLVEEKTFANSTRICYTYDNLDRVTARTIRNISDASVISTEAYIYDAAGNFLNKYISENMECLLCDTNSYLFETDNVDFNRIYIDGIKIEANANKYPW